jgi:lysine-N-methylase
MSLPLELPLLQNWSCHSCGGCCRKHAIEVTEEERQRILDQQWTETDGVDVRRGLFTWFRGPFWKKQYRLSHQADGSCVFLDERGLCRIHAKFGEAAKPLACRVYPYAFHPSGQRIAVSLRFSCPSAVANKGKPVSGNRADLRQLQALVVPGHANQIPPPPISPTQPLDWPDTLRCISTLNDIIQGNPKDRRPLFQRLLAALFVADMLSKANFEKVRGKRLDEMLDLLQSAAPDEVLTQSHLDSIPKPSLPGWLHFRLMAANYAREDTFAAKDQGVLRRLWMLWAAFRFLRGVGQTPPIRPELAPVPFEHLQSDDFGPLPPEADELFRRYLGVKLTGLHFCGPGFFNWPLCDGFFALVLVVPVTVWLSRWIAAGQQRWAITSADLQQAIAMVDHHHGYSPALGGSAALSRVRQLHSLGDIARLVSTLVR